MLTGQRSTVRGVNGSHGQPHPEADGWGPRSGWEKEKEKGLGLVLGPKELGWLDRPNRLSLALWASSVCSSTGWLSFMAWLCAVGWLSLTDRPTVYSPPSLSHWRHGPRGQRPMCVCVACPEGVQGKASKDWPRRERDVAGSPRTARPWWGIARLGRGRPDGGAARLGRARPQGAGVHARGSWLSRAAAWPCHARGTGILGSQRDMVAEGNGGCGSLGGTTGSCTRHG
jgi:hypothetical protein